MLATLRAATFGLLGFATPAFAEEPAGHISTPQDFNQTVTFQMPPISPDQATGPTGISPTVKHSPVDVFVKYMVLRFEHATTTAKWAGGALAVSTALGGGAIALAAKRRDKKFENGLTLLKHEETIEKIRSEISSYMGNGKTVDECVKTFIELFKIETQTPSLLIESTNQIQAGNIVKDAQELRILLGKKINNISNQLGPYLVRDLYVSGSFRGNESLNENLWHLMRFYYNHHSYRQNHS